LRKDQSYFLFSLRQDQLARAIFPLGEKTKSDTREVARHCNLKTADKEESMEICFVPDNNYGGFLQSANLVQKHRGEITWICTATSSASTTALNFTPSASAKVLASPRASRFMSWNWMRKTIASSSATIPRSTAMNSRRPLQLASVRQVDRANRSHGENPLQPSWHDCDGDAAGK
jgi:hypothetical protein